MSFRKYLKLAEIVQKVFDELIGLGLCFRIEVIKCLVALGGGLVYDR